MPRIAAWLHDDDFGWRRARQIIRPQGSPLTMNGHACCPRRVVPRHRLLLDAGRLRPSTRWRGQAPAAAQLLKTSRVHGVCYGCTHLEVSIGQIRGERTCGTSGRCRFRPSGDDGCKRAEALATLGESALPWQSVYREDQRSRAKISAREWLRGRGDRDSLISGVVRIYER